MKELSIDQKAKRYDEVVERAKEKYAMFEGMQAGDVLEDIFPELKESDDEKIRKALVEMVHDTTGDSLWIDYNVHKEDAIDWLEKQGEQDAITFNDAHIINSALNDYCCKQYNALHKENGGVLSFARLQHLAMDIYGWCKKQGEQKPAEWSEEDERMFNSALWHVKNSCGNGGKNSGEFEVYNWLKSLKDRYAWKPSDEQMDALETAVSSLQSTALESLYQRLNKLT